MHRKIWKHRWEKLNKNHFWFFVLLFCVCVCVSFFLLFIACSFRIILMNMKILMCLTIYLTRKQYNNSNRLKSLLYPIQNICCCCNPLNTFFHFVSSNQIVFLFVWIVSICVLLVRLHLQEGDTYKLWKYSVEISCHRSFWIYIFHLL